MNSRYSFSSIYLGPLHYWSTIHARSNSMLISMDFFFLYWFTFIHLLIHQQIFYFPFYFAINALLGRMDTMVSQHTRATGFMVFQYIGKKYFSEIISSVNIQLEREMFWCIKAWLWESLGKDHELKPEE